MCMASCAGEKEALPDSENSQTAAAAPVPLEKDVKPAHSGEQTEENIQGDIPYTQDDNFISDSEPDAISPEDLLESMTLGEKVGQLFIVTPESLGTQTEFNDSIADSISAYCPGGIVLFGKNIISPSQVTELISGINQCSTLGMFVSVDEEGGSVARIGGAEGFDTPEYPDMGILALQGSEAVYNAYTDIGRYLSEYGFNLDFAPVADVNTNPDNPVIGKRAFSSDAGEASEMVQAAVSGLKQSGIISCIKHFPGHGDTAQDSHKVLASTDKTLQELTSCELIPFLAGIEADCGMVMVGHITAVNVTGDYVPASLSKYITTDLLRGNMGYDGVVITDSMSMDAICRNYTSSEAAVEAIKAGADIILMPEDFVQAYSAVAEAVLSGEISNERLNESVLRILRLKCDYGII